jgi:hypothetical protein
MVDAPGKVTLWGIEVFAAIAEEDQEEDDAPKDGSAPIRRQRANLRAQRAKIGNG